MRSASGCTQKQLSPYAEHCNYFRDYDPVIGRYVESDPIGLRGGLNSFAYVENSPLLLLDRRGLDAAGRAIGRAVGMWGGRVIGGAVGSVEPGGGTAVGAWLGGTLGSAAGAAIGDAVGNWCKAQANDKDDCKKHFNDCLTSGWGGKVGFDSACLACFQRGQGTGTWPDSVTTGLRGQYPVSCEYWLKKP
jgi:RHS repeat-associated protein